MAAGKIVTGFSKPYVAKYAFDTDVSYTSGQLLSQGVDIAESVEQADDNNFYADNVTSETEDGIFTSGELALTVKGLDPAAETLIMGLPAAGTDGFTTYDDDQSVPECGFGCVVRYQKDGVVTYTPIIWPRGTFQFVTVNAATQEENIDFQTQALTFNIKRSEAAKRPWKKVGAECQTEAAAEDAIKEFFGIQ